ncbi:hypothetical protein HaLaN_11536, partial [Haematococcus lacustris]
ATAQPSLRGSTPLTKRLREPQELLPRKARLLEDLSNASEAQQLEASNAVLQQQLDELLQAMRTMHQDNEAMKQQLLVSCRRCEIPAQLEQLNARIAQHQPPSQPSGAAIHLAASVLEQ